MSSQKVNFDHSPTFNRNQAQLLTFKLTRIDYLRTKDQCYITGWGYTGQDSSNKSDLELGTSPPNSDIGTDYLATFSDVVKRANVKLTPFSQCKDAYRADFRKFWGPSIKLRHKLHVLEILKK